MSTFESSVRRAAASVKPSSSVGWVVAAVALALLLVLFLPVVSASLAALAQVLGLGTILIGVHGLITFRNAEADGIWAFSAPIALVLTGSMLMAPGWGAGIGLGILGAAALYVAATSDE